MLDGSAWLEVADRVSADHAVLAEDGPPGAVLWRFGKPLHCRGSVLGRGPR